MSQQSSQTDNLLALLSLAALKYQVTPEQKKDQQEGDSHVLSVYFLGDGEFQVQSPEEQWTTNYEANANEGVLRDFFDVIAYMYKTEFMDFKEYKAAEYQKEDQVDSFGRHIFLKLHRIAGLLPEDQRPWYYNQAEEYIKSLEQ